MSLSTIDAPANGSGGPATAVVPSGFHVVHLVTGRDGRTHIEELDPRQASENLPYLYRSKATSVSVLRYPAGHEFEWRAVPGRSRLMVQLRGLCVLIVNSGAEPGVSYRPLAPGTVLLDEDRSGRAHRCKVFEDEDVYFMQVDLAASGASK
jgi:hypothetical protein